MQRRQSAQLRDGGFIQGERRDEMQLALLRDELRGRLWQRQFAEAVLDGNFPKRNGAQKNRLAGSRTAAETAADNLASPDTSQRNSQVSKRIFIYLQTSATRLQAAGR